MKVQINKSKLNGNLDIVPSKSYAHRLLFAAALSKNESIISNVVFSDDILATLDCIKNYGREFLIDGNKVKFLEDKNSIDKKDFIPEFNCNESGTTLRIFLPIALTKFNHFKIKAKERLIERGVGIYEEIFKNVKFIKSKNEIEVIGSIEPGIYNLPGDISSQYISGLMFALPVLNGDSEIHLTTELKSKNYVDMTLDVLNKSNVNIASSVCDNNVGANACGARLCDNIYKVFGSQVYAPLNETVEGDYSNAAFIDVFNYLGSKVTINNLNPNSLQGDKAYIEYFKILDKEFATIDISNAIDLGPVLFAFASIKNGAKFIGTSRLKIKESDRAVVMKQELEKFGVIMQINEDDVIIVKSNLHKADSAIDSHNDHRIAMSISMFSSIYDIEIEDAEAVNKSYPDFYKDLQKLGANIIYE